MLTRLVLVLRAMQGTLRTCILEFVIPAGGAQHADPAAPGTHGVSEAEHARGAAMAVSGRSHRQGCRGGLEEMDTEDSSMGSHSQGECIRHFRVGHH